MITSEQEEYRRSLKKRRPRFKEMPEFPPFSFWNPYQTVVWYFNNCHWWVNDLTDQGTSYPADKERMLDILSSIEKHCQTMRDLLNK